jgi:acetyl esterase/lipase
MLAARWAAAGSEVETLILPELPHGFMAVPCSLTSHWATRTYEWFARRLEPAAV